MDCEICQKSRGSDVHVYILNPEHELIAVCVWCDPVFWNSTPARVEEPYALISADAEERYTQYQPYKKARQAFKQIYDPDLHCHRNNKDGNCTDQVAKYYFSDGGTLAFCTTCANQGRRISPMMDLGIPISVQYDEEVYKLLP